MRVIISAGGTGGHIYPALAIINKIKEMEPSEILYIGTHDRMEKDIVPKYGINYKEIEIYGFNRKHIFKNIKTIKCFYKSYLKCKKIIKNFKPDVVIGVGGYVTGPVILAAHKLEVKTFIHEQNSIPGTANTFLSKYADSIGISFKSSMKYFPEYKTHFTGNPSGDEALKQIAISKKSLGLDNNKKLVLIVMGSLGSSKINDYFIKNIVKFKNKDYQILFISGKDNYDSFKNLKLPNNVHVIPYLEHLSRIMKQTDLIVSRAGASILSEIINLQIPSILIPSPYVPNNHQYKNALDLIENNAAILLEEKNLTDNSLVKMIDNTINDNNKLQELKNNMKPLKVNDSSKKIYEILKELVGSK